MEENDDADADSANFVPQIILMVILTLINAFFASAEMAVVSANKNKIKRLANEGNKKAKAVEKLFEVKVLNVNTMIVKGKTKRVRYVEGKTPDWKKAIVTIDTDPSDKTYLGKGGKAVKVSKKYKDSIDEFMGA